MANKNSNGDQKILLQPQSSLLATRTPPRTTVTINSSEETKRREANLSYNLPPQNSTDSYYGSPCSSAGTRADVPTAGTAGTCSTESGFLFGPQQQVVGRVPGISPDFPVSTISTTKNTNNNNPAGQAAPSRTSAITNMTAFPPVNAMGSNPSDLADVCSVGSSSRCPNSPTITQQTNNYNATNTSTSWEATMIRREPELPYLSTATTSCGESMMPPITMAHVTVKQSITSTVVYNRADPALHREYEVPSSTSLVVFGYLSKKTRNGVWQKRYFETDGERLRYYKSEKRTKLLASLDLANVGKIVQDEADASGCCFTIQVAGRPYYLMAQDRSTCKDWVINLNRVREARIQIGRMKLVSANDEEKGGSRVVVRANRGRTHRFNNDDEFLEFDQSLSSYRNSWMANPSLSRWEKRGTGLQRMRHRLMLWARKIRRMGCFSHENEVVQQYPSEGPTRNNEPHYYPHGPGLMSDGTDTVGESDVGISKDEPAENSKAGQHSAWVAKETKISNLGISKRGLAVVVDGGRTTAHVDDEDEGTRTLS